MAGSRPLIDLGDWGLDPPPPEAAPTPHFHKSKVVLPPPPEGPPRRRRSEPSLYPLATSPIQDVSKQAGQPFPALDLLSDSLPQAGPPVGNPFLSANGSTPLNQSTGAYPPYHDEGVRRSYDVAHMPSSRVSRSLPPDILSSREGVFSSQAVPRNPNEQSVTLSNGMGVALTHQVRSKSPLPPLSRDPSPLADPSSLPPLPSPILSDSPHLPPSFGQARSEPASLASSTSSFHGAPVNRSTDFTSRGGTPGSSGIPPAVRRSSPMRASAPAADCIDELFASLSGHRQADGTAGSSVPRTASLPGATPSSNPFASIPPQSGADGFSFQFGKANPFFTPSTLTPLAESSDTAEGASADVTYPVATDWEDQFDFFVNNRLPPSSPPPSTVTESVTETVGPSFAGSESAGPSPAGTIWKVLHTQGLAPAPDPEASLTVAPSFKLDSPKVAKQPAIFVGRKGGAAAPMRAAVSPNRPTCIELRPAPLRGSKADQPARALACTETAVWAAVDGGVKVWIVEAATATASSGENNVTAGDEDAAAFTFLAVHGTTKVLCLCADFGREVVWSGHSDGKARAWPMAVPGPGAGEAVTSSLIWGAHKSAVTALCVTPYGERPSFGCSISHSCSCSRACRVTLLRMFMSQHRQSGAPTSLP